MLFLKIWIIVLIVLILIKVSVDRKLLINNKKRINNLLISNEKVCSELSLVQDKLLSEQFISNDLKQKLQEIEKSWVKLNRTIAIHSSDSKWNASCKDIVKISDELGLLLLKK